MTRDRTPLVTVAWCKDCGELSAGDPAPQWALDHALSTKHDAQWMESI